MIRNGEETKFNCVIGNRSRIFKNLENPNKNGEYSLPMIIIQRTGITKNNDRLTNVNNEVKYASHSGKLNYNLYTPVPIDITFQVTIVSKRQGDIDKALSNFIPFFNKDAFVRYQHPKFKGLFMKCQVIMDDSITEEHPEQLDALEDDIVTCTCSFTFKTWIFCGNDKAYENDVKHRLSVYNCDHWQDCYCSACCLQEFCVSGEVSSVTETEYIGFLPSVRQINVGFYPVPIMSSYLPHMQWVDSLWPEHDDHPYVDRFIWKIDENGEISAQVGNSYHYPPYSSEYLSTYYDERRVAGGEFIDGQLSTYSYLSGPDEAHKPLGPPKISTDVIGQ